MKILGAASALTRGIERAAPDRSFAPYAVSLQDAPEIKVREMLAQDAVHSRDREPRAILGAVAEQISSLDRRQRSALADAERQDLAVIRTGMSQG